MRLLTSMLCGKLRLSPDPCVEHGQLTMHAASTLLSTSAMAKASCVDEPIQGLAAARTLLKGLQSGAECMQDCCRKRCKDARSLPPRAMSALRYLIGRRPGCRCLPTIAECLRSFLLSCLACDLGHHQVYITYYYNGNAICGLWSTITMIS